MSVFKKGSWWHYDFVVDGERKCGSTKIRVGSKANHTAAQTMETQMRAAMLRGEQVDHFKVGKVTLSTFVETRVLPDVRVECKDRPRTVTFYEQSYAKVLGDAIAAMKLKDIGKAQIRDYKRRLTESELAVATINRRLGCLRKALRMAEDEGVIHRAPKVEQLDGENRRQAVLAGVEKELFLAKLPEAVRPAIEFLFETGLRVTELCTLTKDRVYFDGPVSYIKIPRELAKGKKDRFIPLAPKAKGIVVEQMERSRSAFVFVREDQALVDCEGIGGARKRRAGERFTEPLSRHWLSQVFCRLRNEMRLPKDLVLHSTRHSLATEMGGRGADVKTLMTAFGWESMEVANRYVHPVSDNVVRAFGITPAERPSEMQKSK